MALVIIIKIFYNSCNNEQLLFVLTPATKIVEVFTGMNFHFDSSSGYVDLSSGIIIGKSCAGLNFLIIVMCMLIFSFLKDFTSVKSKTAAFLLLIVSSYVITVLVNSFRIVSSILILNMALLNDVFGKDTVHKATGVLFYFFFLILSYYMASKFIRKAGEYSAKAV